MRIPKACAATLENERNSGAIPSDIAVRIAAAPVAQIEEWIDLAIDAPNLSDVFVEN